jgi:hypothetical protein
MSKPKRQDRNERLDDPRFRWTDRLAEDMPPGPQGQPGHKKGTVVTVVQVADVQGIGRVSFPAPRPSALLMAKAKTAMRRAAKLQAALPSQTSSKGWIHPHTDKSFTNVAALFEFFEEAMAGVVLLQAALACFASESVPDGFVFTEDGKSFTREKVEEMGIERRLTRVLPQALQVENVRTAQPEAWARVERLKSLRDDIEHLKARKAYAGWKGDASEVIFTRLLNEADLLGLVNACDAVTEHYGKAPRQVEEASDASGNAND